MYFFILFIVSIIHFYFINNLLIQLLSFIIIIYLIYKIINDNKEENNGDSIYNLAHEVKNPLCVCKGYLDMINSNNLDKYLPIIKSEMNRSLTIMDEFLDLKRIKLDKDLMDFTLLLDDIKETTKLVLKNNNVKLELNNSLDEVIIDGDYDKLKQVLMNLIKNSYEAVCSNIKIDLKTNKEYLKLKIIDDGKGISKEDLKKIGTPLYTTKVTGTGLGVSLSKEIIKLHEGEIKYDSTINKGTKVTIILPIKYIF